MAAELIDFTSKLDGYASFYTGTGATELVPHVFPVAINGRPYMIDSKSGDYGRQFDARVRDSVDQSAEPGESAINPQGLWRRSQSSWHYGAGQLYSDTADAEAYRFHKSKGVNVWNRAQLTLLSDTSQIVASANSNLYMATADSRLYVTDGQTVKYTSDLSTFTTVTGTAASNLYSIASDGYNVFYSYANGDIDQTNAGVSTSSAYITGIEAGVMAYVKGRLMVAGQGVDKRKIWNITTTPGSSANNPTALYTHPNTNWSWVGFAAGQNHIYCAGYSGNRSLIYKTQIRADGTALDIPTVAAELPQGEIIYSLNAYLGFTIIGLANGIRFCSSDGDGNLVVGPLIRTDTVVRSSAAIAEYIYFGWTNFDSTSTGLGRLNVADQVAVNQPAYASDLMVTGQGNITDVHEYGLAPVFAVAGLGFYKKHATDLVASGFLDSGVYRWGVPDAKFVPKWDLRTEPLVGTVRVSGAYNSGDDASDGSFNTIGTMTQTGILEATFDGAELKVFEVEARLTLTRSSTNSAVGPTVTRWMARAYAAPLRSQIFSVPLLLHHVITPSNGKDYWIDVEDERTRLEDLVLNPRVVTYQEGTKSYSVIVEDIRWSPIHATGLHNPWDWEGTCTVLMRSVR
jgi:hypothetical protein